MAEETTDKSIVVWHPSLVYRVPDVREWTSLCLYHDQILLRTFLFDVEEEHDSFLDFWLTKPGSRERFSFINSVRLLAEQNVIRLIKPEEFTQVTDFNMVNKVHIPNGLEHRFEKFFKQNITKIKDNLDMILEGIDITDAVISSITSKLYHYPLVTNDASLQSPTHKIMSPQVLSEILAQSAICQFALPDVRTIHVEDLLEARNELKDELLEFRAGILKLTWLLHQQVQNKNDLEQIRQEADALVNTVIKGALLSLENRMKQHKKKAVRRLLFGTGKVIVEATKLFLPGGFQEKMIAGGKSLLQMATEIDSEKPPEDQIAAYLYKLMGKFKNQ